MLRRIGLICALAMGLYLIGNYRVPLWDRDEPRYAQTSRQMLHDHDWVLPRFLNTIRFNKPPLIYWCQATAMRWLGENSAAARLPSAIAVAIGAFLLGAFLWRRTDGRRAAMATLVFCTCMATIASAKMCLTDGVLLLWMVIGQGALYCLRYETPRRWIVPAIFWLSVGLAALTKGYAPIMHLATMIVLACFEVGRRWKSPAAWKEAIAWWRRLRFGLGLLIILIVVGPWMVLVFRQDPQFLTRLWDQAVRHTTSGTEGHGHPPGYYLLMIWATMFPWSLLLPTAIGIGLRHRDQPLSRFALAAAIGPWLVMEFVTNKLPFYILPSFPALGFLVADAISRSTQALRGQRDDDLKRPVFLLGVAAWDIATLGLAAVPWIFLSRLGPVPRWQLILLTLFSIAWAGAVTICFVYKKIPLAVGTMGYGMFAVSALLFGVILPDLPVLNSARTLGYKLAALHAGDGPTPIHMLEYREPSMAFYAGGHAVESPAPTAGWNVTTEEHWDEFPPPLKAKYKLVWELPDVLVYAGGGKTVNVVILRKIGS